MRCTYRNNFFLNKQDAYHSKIQAAAFAWGIWPTLTACLLSFRQLRRNWYETTSEHILKLLCDIYWIRCLRSPHATTSWNFLSTSHLIVAPHTAMTLTHSLTTIYTSHQQLRRRPCVRPPAMVMVGLAYHVEKIEYMVMGFPASGIDPGKDS